LKLDPNYLSCISKEYGTRPHTHHTQEGTPHVFHLFCIDVNKCVLRWRENISTW